MRLALGVPAATRRGGDEILIDAAVEDGGKITERESQVLRLVAVGHSNVEIAEKLLISVKTVEVHKSNAMRKLGLTGRVDVIRYGVLQGWPYDT